MRKNYLNRMNWAVIYFISRNTQDDKKDKLHVCAVFENATTAKDYFINNLPNQDTYTRYICNVDDLDRLEEFYNHVNDLKNNYPTNWIFHLDEKYFTSDEENRFRTILDLWNM